MKKRLQTKFVYFCSLVIILIIATINGFAQMPTPTPTVVPNVQDMTYDPNLQARDDIVKYTTPGAGQVYLVRSNDGSSTEITIHSQSYNIGTFIQTTCGFDWCGGNTAIGYSNTLIINGQPTQTSSYGVDIAYYYDIFSGTFGWTHSNLARVILIATANDDAENAGESCPVVGQPINVTNGNMWLKQNDYNLPGLGEPIKVTRFYNSLIQTSGMFGTGWATQYDESLQVYGDKLARLNMPDGRAVYLFRETTSEPFLPHTPDFYGFITKNTDGTYTLTFKDGRKHHFNSNGILQWQKDRNGNQTTLNYNTNNILTSITDSSGRVLTVNMTNGLVQSLSDSLGTIATYIYFPGTTHLKEVIYQDGSKYKFEYDTMTVSGKTFLKTVKDANDKILETHEYDSLGRATTSEKEGGVEKYIFDYSTWIGPDPNIPYSPYTLVKHKKNASDPNFIETKYYFDKSKGKNFVWRTQGNCNCGGGTEFTDFEYDDKLNLKKKKEYLSSNDWLETNYTYNYQGDMLTKTDTWGTMSLTYNPFGQPLTITDRMNGVWTLTYDANGNIKTITNPLSQTTTLNYPTTNNKGLPVSITNARNKTTNYQWYANGLLKEIEDANLKKTTYTYDARSRIKTVTNALQHQTQYNYFDDSQRKVEMIYPNNDKITYEYDIRRLLQKVTDERGKITNYQFDDAYRLIKITDPLGHFSEYGYDLMSNMTSYKDGVGNITNYKYDDFDRLTEIEYPPATTGATRLKVNYSYDDIGRIKTFSNTDSRITTYNYLDAQRKNEIINAENEKTTLEYNQRFQTIKVTDATNQVYNFSYDPLGRTLSQTRAGATMSYEYDEVGNQKKRIDYLGRVTEYVYDNLNRLEKIKYFASEGMNQTLAYQSTYTYDDISRLKTAVNEAGTVSFNYDNRNRITSTTDVFGQTVAYEYVYNSTVNKMNLKLNGNLHTVYNFDDADRLISLTDEDSGVYTFGYDEADKLITKTLPNNVETTYNYDGMSRLTRLKDSTTTATLFDRQYGYNNANQIGSITEPTNTRTFGYDNVDRLTSMTNGTANESYNYDDVGNRTSSHLSTSYGYQSNNRLTSTQTASMLYNAEGNQFRKYEGKDLWRYNFDHDNRLTFAKNRRERVNYTYDALGRRVRTSNFLKGSTKYTYDGLDVIQDDDSNTGITKYQNGLGIDNKLKLKNGSNSSYFLADHLGSTNGLVNSSGNLTSSASYDSFGNKTGNLNTRYQFTGREKDNVTGLYYYRARWYDSKLGRFISEDPIGFAGGDVNLYGYVGNNPQNFTDPFGLQGESGNLPASWSRTAEQQRHIDRGLEQPQFQRPENLNPSTANSYGDWYNGARWDRGKMALGEVPTGRMPGYSKAGVPGLGEAITTLEMGPQMYDTFDLIGRKKHDEADILRCINTGNCNFTNYSSFGNSYGNRFYDELSYWESFKCTILGNCPRSLNDFCPIK